jgi:hypothetical protein
MTSAATAKGTFDVKLEPLPTDDHALGRFRVNKTFAGDLVGTGEAQMLSIGTVVEGSAGYVAIDRIDGTLHGRQGSFVLQHNGLMERGEGTLQVVVVPDSGTADLTGLRGQFDIQIVDGEHRYVFDYSIDPS